VQSILHSLFLPTPFKVLSHSISESTSQQKESDSKDPSESRLPRSSTSLIREEVLKPGALYAECAVVNLNLSIPSPLQAEVEAETEKSDGSSSKGKGKDKDKGLKEEVLQITDDGEYGGEAVGRMVWEAYEAALKIWEKPDNGKDS
jgi:hypothetical protein